MGRRHELKPVKLGPIKAQIKVRPPCPLQQNDYLTKISVQEKDIPKDIPR